MFEREARTVFEERRPSPQAVIEAGIVRLDEVKLARRLIQSRGCRARLAHEKQRPDLERPEENGNKEKTMLSSHLPRLTRDPPHLLRT
ncbi:MAG: hypothetical protein M3Q32_13260, partial [Pseudomonadota bacterium]|nr:hypothetical protein [Pseudomonadota bacterium]